MATFNLVRNSRVFFTTNVNSAGKVGVNDSGTAVAYTTTNAQELQVLDGFTFSQSSNADVINISESGATPVRGQRSFNSSLGTVEFSFSTYIRPYLSTTVKAEEGCLWNALLGATALGTAATASAGAFTYLAGNLTMTGTGYNYKVGDTFVVKGVTGAGASQFNTGVKVTSATSTVVVFTYIVTPSASWVTGNFVIGTVGFSKLAWNEHSAITADVASTTGGGIPTAYTEASTVHSNKNTLLPFGLVMTVDGITYAIDNCALDQAVVNFDLAGIAMIAWTGKGTVLRQLADITYAAPSSGAVVITGTSISGSIAAKNTTASFITNKLSTVSLTSNIGGISGTAYSLALTGGSITISNNLTYLTPANIGVINSPVGYYTGTRAISGSLTAYLRTGSTNTAGLISTLLSNSATTAGIEPKYKLQVELGGSNNSTRVEVQIDGAFLQIPTIDAQAVMSTTINFTAQGSEATQSASSGYDIENTNDLEIRYLAV